MKYIVKSIAAVFLIAIYSCSMTPVEETKDCELAVSVLKGKYRGKNLFVRNNYMGIQKLYLNGKLLSDEFSDSFEIDLSQLEMDDSVRIRIEFCENSPNPYQVLNPEAIK